MLLLDYNEDRSIYAPKVFVPHDLFGILAKKFNPKIFKLNMIWMKTISKKGPVTVTMPQIKSDEIEGALFIAGI